MLDVALPSILVLFGLTVAVPLPALAVMAFYTFVYGAATTISPLISQLATECAKTGHPVNFGLARGCGSVSYAVSAAVLGQVVSGIGFNVLVAVLGAAGVASLVLAHSLPTTDAPRARRSGASAVPSASRVGRSGEVRGRSVWSFMRTYRLLTLALVGFALAYAASSCLSTYLINIVGHLGGDTSVYGFAVLFMASSELPAMACVNRLRRSWGTGALLALGGAAYLVRNLLVSFAPSLPVLFAGVVFQGLSFGILTPLFTQYASETCAGADGMMGQTMITVLTAGVGSMVGNLLGGVLQDTLGLGAMFAFVAVMTVAGAALLAACGLWGQRRHHAGAYPAVC